MYILEVFCRCGFRSEPAVWGPESLFEQSRVGIPVYIPSSGKLFTHWFDSRNLEIQAEQLDLWISENGFQVVKVEYGEEAFIVVPSDAGNRVFGCPRCHQYIAHVEVVGMH